MHAAPVFTTRAKTATIIDPLGLQNANMSLYRTLFFGINNVVDSIRVYSAFCWMVRLASERADAIPKEKAEERRELCAGALEKIDLLLVWCNRTERSGLPGTERVWPEGDEPATLRLAKILSKAQEEKQKATGNVNTARGAYLMTAPQYRPSIINGLRFLAHSTQIKGFYELTSAGKELADAFAKHLDEVVAQYRSDAIPRGDDPERMRELAEWLADPEDLSIVPARVPELYPLLRLDKPHRDEQEAFLNRYLPSPGAQPEDLGEEWRYRHQGITLVLRAIIAAEKGPGVVEGYVPEEIVRHAMGSGLAPDGTKVDIAELIEARGVWASLQVRQYLKLALETLLRLTEVETRRLMVTDAHRIQQVADAVANQASDGEHAQSPLSFWLNRWKTGQGSADTLYEAGAVAHAKPAIRSLPVLFEELKKNIGFRSESGARKAVYQVLGALTYCAVEAGNWKGNDAYRLADGRDRLAPQRLAELADRYAARPADEFLSMIVRDFVVNLHFKVARERAETEPTNPRERYILVPGDEGIELNLDRETTFKPPVLTDRLLCAMLLLTQTGLLKKAETMGMHAFKVTPKGYERAAEFIPASHTGESGPALAPTSVPQDLPAVA
ncbi:hypothetical protein E9536_40735 [Burkholderia sp. LS-044]|uniref:hypothetical protein n=1 Tax=Burkholderia sp. LS-044 TaxID=1459967 RepID=UPI0010A63BBD|nr:hypothetical protein [Burkholderia sp. LS-044]THJ45671.1 hypothetical protein E9536_40735 [Burkholderia sp. LS-044]